MDEDYSFLALDFSLGKGEVDSSILSGSTSKTSITGEFPAIGSGSPEQNQAEQNAIERGERVEEVSFRSDARDLHAWLQKHRSELPAETFDLGTIAYYALLSLDQPPENFSRADRAVLVAALVRFQQCRR